MITNGDKHLHDFNDHFKVNITGNNFDRLSAREKYHQSTEKLLNAGELFLTQKDKLKKKAHIIVRVLITD